MCNKGFDIQGDSRDNSCCDSDLDEIKAILKEIIARLDRINLFAIRESNMVNAVATKKIK